MSSRTNVRAFQYILQDSIKLEDKEWTYHVPNLPLPSNLNREQLIKSLSLVSTVDRQQVVLRLQTVSPNRAISSDPLDRFILISFSNFRLRLPKGSTNGDANRSETQPATARESADYAVRLLKSGVVLNGVHYNFYGHSNSQLKSRTCFLYAASKVDITQKVNALGDFSKMKTVAKKAKRIGLLFSNAQVVMDLDPGRCKDIEDAEIKDYIFTDGCGLISPHLARELARRRNIVFRNLRYTPSVFQIRYLGYKGVLMVDPTMKDGTLAKFRKSMKKFSGGTDKSFAVVEYSKPYSFGYLNDEVILLLHALGTTDTVLLKKQAEHFEFLAEATQNPRTAFRFLTYLDEMELAEKLLMESLDSVRPRIVKLVNSECDRMLNKRDEQKCRILVRKSRLIYGVCDSFGVLKEGECAVKVTIDGDGVPRAISNTSVLVTRNPCLHPGDLQKFKAVECGELSHLLDCIVFPIRGRRPAADMMSGGDLDGDKFFVCWDEDLIPEILFEPAAYVGAKEPLSFKPITDDDRLEYFARYTNASLGRAKSLYLDWARLKGPMSVECQELNHLFSTCVDGNRIKIPQKLESPSQPPQGTPFILDTLQDAAREWVQARQESRNSYDGYRFDAMELLLSRDNVAMSEFELLKLTHRWCRKNDASLVDFLQFFDFNLLTAEEKSWTLEQLPPSRETASEVMNALCRSNLIQDFELQRFKLGYPGLRWKCIFDSSQDRIATFLDTVSRTLELFRRKLVVIRVDERLTLAIYVPLKIEKRQEIQIDNRCRLFAFPHSQGEGSSHRLALPTKMNYRLYCDENIFQLFENTRGNSWVYIVRGPSNDDTYRSMENRGDKRRQRQATVDNGLNFDFLASIALDKFSRGLQRHIGRVTKNGLLAAEIYVISNRDVKSMKTLDLWLQYVDTMEVMPLFERDAKEYTIPKISDVDWSTEPTYLIQIAKEDFSAFNTLESDTQYCDIFNWILERDARSLLLRCFKNILSSLENGRILVEVSAVLETMLNFLQQAPFLAIAFASIDFWDYLEREHPDLLRTIGPKILQAHILSANDMEEFIVEPFKRVLSRLQSMPLTDFGNLIELISLTVRSSELALDLLLDCIEPESLRILSHSNELVQHFTQNLMGIALDHIDEATQPQPPRKDLLELKPSGHSQGYMVVESHLRIDAPAGTLAVTDHVRLTAASSPTNSCVTRKYTMDALVESYEPGLARFRCFHPPPPFLTDCSWELRNCGSFVTSKTMINAVGAFATLPEECCGISDQVLGIQSKETMQVNGKLPVEEQASDKLNASQNAAVAAALSSSFISLWGPPGTGKTYTIVEIIRRLQQLPGKRRILVTAPTHNAVDNVMRKYLMTIAGEGAKEVQANALRVSTDVRKVAEDLKKNTCDAMLGKEVYASYSAFNKARDQIKKCNLVFTTCIGAGLGLLRTEQFDTVIVDEASQQTEPASLVPLVKGCKKAILVGDHVQLGPTVQQHALSLDFDVSLFERLWRQKEVLQNGSKENGNGSAAIAKVMLDTQYRMHKSICQFSSDEFYESKLLTGIPDNSRTLTLSQFPWPPLLNKTSTPPSQQGRMVFVECTAPEEIGQKSKSNQGQAEICHTICRLLCTEPNSVSQATSAIAAPISPQSIAVLTPYRRQIELLKPRLSSLTNVEVSSIDGFQGREADIVIFVTVRCNAHHEIGFLKDLRRMNVALTRAKAGVVVIGNRGTLTMGTADEDSTAVWKRLLAMLVEVKIA